MKKLTGKIVFKLVLMIIMVIQPVAVTHAMASMDYSHHRTASVSADMHHDEHHQMMNHEQMDGHIGHQESSDNNSDMNDCCNTSACCPAAIFEIMTLEHIQAPEYSAHLHTSWKGVILPSETKPPRRL